MKYDLHDSLIERADYFPETGRAELKIRLCNWRQSGYRDTDPEIVCMTMIFDAVEQFEVSVSGYAFCDNEILAVTEPDSHTVKFVFLADGDGETLTIKARKVSYAIDV
ncbi:MAG: hypothetical protein K2K87_07785 [Lachnospiraceae bacterium]|nr:hypothetical protein [Lachnospiraceae bacterium]